MGIIENDKNNSQRFRDATPFNKAVSCVGRENVA